MNNTSLVIYEPDMFILGPSTKSIWFVAIPAGALAVGIIPILIGESIIDGIAIKNSEKLTTNLSGENWEIGKVFYDIFYNNIQDSLSFKIINISESGSILKIHKEEGLGFGGKRNPKKEGLLKDQQIDYTIFTSKGIDSVIEIEIVQCGFYVTAKKVFGFKEEVLPRLSIHARLRRISDKEILWQKTECLDGEYVKRTLCEDTNFVKGLFQKMALDVMNNLFKDLMIVNAPKALK